MPEPSNQPTKINIGDFVFAFLFPTALGKGLVIYFGLNYSNDRGAIYGWGLLLSIGFTISTVIAFLWKYRNYQD